MHLPRGAARTLTRALLAGSALFAAGTRPAHAQTIQLVANGGFETGDFTGWTRQVQLGSFGDLVVFTGTSSPLSSSPVPGARSGTSYALTDQTARGGYALSQTFTIDAPVSSAILGFSLSVANRSSSTADLGTFLTGGAPNQYATVDLYAGAVSGFATSGPLRTFYRGSTLSLGSVPWTDYSFDLTNLLGAPGTYTLRFAEVDNQGYFNLAVDNVSLVIAPAVSSVPEPSTGVLLGSAMLLLVGVGLRRRARAT